MPEVQDESSKHADGESVDENVSSKLCHSI